MSVNENIRLRVEFCYFSTCCHYLKKYKIITYDIYFDEETHESKSDDDVPEVKRLFVSFTLSLMTKHQEELVFQFLIKEQIEYQLLSTEEFKAPTRFEFAENLKNLSTHELLLFTVESVEYLRDYETNYEPFLKDSFEKHRFMNAQEITSLRARLITYCCRERLHSNNEEN